MLPHTAQFRNCRAELFVKTRHCVSQIVDICATYGLDKNFAGKRGTQRIKIDEVALHHRRECTFALSCSIITAS